MTVAIIQARLGSTRLPGKVLRPIAGRPMLWHIVKRVGAAPGIDGVVVATSDRANDRPLRDFCASEGIHCFAGSEEDVLDRFFRAAQETKASHLVRITADCPLADPEIIGRVVSTTVSGGYDYAAVATGAGAAKLREGRYPDGLDAECMRSSVLETAWREATHQLDREHVTPFIWRNTNRFKCTQLLSPVDYSTLRWTVDNQSDFDLVARIYDALYRPGETFGMQDVLSFLSQHPDVSRLNSQFVGTEGYLALHELPTASDPKRNS